MSWLRTSPIRQSFSRSNRARTLENNTDFDEKACYDSFCKHWQQVHDIILRVEVLIQTVSYLTYCCNTILIYHCSHENRPAMMMFWALLVTSIIWSLCYWLNCKTVTNSKCPGSNNPPHLAKNSCSARTYSTNSTNGANQREGN